MKCPECGSEVAAGEQFCGNCGAPVEATEEALPDHDRGREAFSDETVISEAPVIPPPEPEPPLGAVEPDLPPPPPPAAPSAAGGGKMNKTTIIVIIVVAVVILLCCCCLVALVALFTSDVGQDILYELDLVMRPLLTSVV